MDIDIVPALLSLSRLIVLCQFANWLWIRSSSSDHLSVSGRLSGLSPAKHETNELFSMAHTRKIQCQWSSEAWVVEITAAAAAQQYHILFLVLCVTFPYLVTLGTWFNHWSRPFAIIYLRLLFWGYHSQRINCGPVPSPLATMATFHCILSFLLFCETEAKLRIWLASSPDKGREAPQPT